MTTPAPGAYRKPVDRWGDFARLCRRLPDDSLVLLDRVVARLHPVRRPLERARVVLELAAGEGAKTTETLERVLRAGVELPRGGCVVVVGGGTLGDLATVAAHLLKRGLPLVHVPTTLLAAVDSSLGGKGALNVGTGAAAVKNAAGVFHYPVETWLCPALWASLPERRVREGRIEAWKMLASLDARGFARHLRREAPLAALVRDARRLKAKVCATDPYDLSGRRAVLNFGHTFGHAFESATGFALSHGDAVGLGMRCALDVGRRLGVTPPGVVEHVEEALTRAARAPARARLRAVLAGVSTAALDRWLSADKKNARAGQLRMVLLSGLGSALLRDVPRVAWQALLPAWRDGGRP